MTTTTTNPSVARLDIDPFASETLKYPQQFHQLLHQHPVSYIPQHDIYAIGRFAEVSEAVSNWQQLASGKGIGYHPSFRPQGLVEMDPPFHDTPRAVLQNIMSARVLRAMTETCTYRAKVLMDDLFAGTTSGDVITIDALKDIGEVFPIEFFPDISGLRTEGRENLLPYADLVFNQVGPAGDPTKLIGCPRQEMERLVEWVNESCQRENLADVGFGSDIFAAADRGEILHDFAPLLTRSLVSAGVDTTVNGIATMLYGLAAFPEEFAKLRAHPRLSRVAFDEALRWESPAAQFFRRTLDDVQIGGVTIPAGSKVLLSFGAANRDPARWERPEQFDLDRDPSGHLALGMGVHQCVGQHAARLQGVCLLEQFLPRAAALSVDHHAVIPEANAAIRGWESVPLQVTVA